MALEAGSSSTKLSGNHPVAPLGAVPWGSVSDGQAVEREREMDEREIDG
jgi:hypothetical protein